MCVDLLKGNSSISTKGAGEGALVCSLEGNKTGTDLCKAAKSICPSDGESTDSRAFVFVSSS